MEYLEQMAILNALRGTNPEFWRTKKRRMATSIFCQPTRHNAIPTPPSGSKQGRKPEGLVVNLFWNVSFQEGQKRVSLSRFGCGVATLGGGNGGSGDRFGGIVSGEFRSEVGGEGRNLRWSGSRELFYGTDVVICGLERTTKVKKVSPSEC